MHVCEGKRGYYTPRIWSSKTDPREDDYILSFFFFLDIISTITLARLLASSEKMKLVICSLQQHRADMLEVIDLTWIADIFQGDEEDVDLNT